MCSCFTYACAVKPDTFASGVVREDELVHFSLRVLPSVPAVKVMLIPVYGDADLLLSFQVRIIAAVRAVQPRRWAARLSASPLRVGPLACLPPWHSNAGALPIATHTGSVPVDGQRDVGDG